MKDNGDMVPPGKRIIEINSERMNLLNHYLATITRLYQKMNY